MCSFTDLSKSQEMETPTELSSMTGGGGSWIIYSERERERERRVDKQSHMSPLTLACQTTCSLELKNCFSPTLACQKT